MQEKHQEYAKEIFNLEMRLREILSFIFLDTYKGDYYNLAKETDVKIQPLNKGNKPNEEYYDSHFENEFFFLLFSNYIRLSNLKEIEYSDFIEAFLDADSWGGLQQKIQNRGIIKKEYQDFLAGIKQNLDPIENIRNCIAHNRSIPKSDNYKTITDYNKAKKELDESIDTFWDGLQNED